MRLVFLIPGSDRISPQRRQGQIVYRLIRSELADKKASGSKVFADKMIRGQGDAPAVGPLNGPDGFLSTPALHGRLRGAQP